MQSNGEEETNDVLYDSIGIEFSAVDFGQRERTEYNLIPELAESISDVGLQVPIILSPLPDGRYRLEDGGRRYRALESLGVTRLYRGATGDPQRPGYVLKERVSTDESAWLTELTANLHREDFHWMDAVRLLVKAWRRYEKEQHLQSKRAYYATFGKLVGTGYADINAAIELHDAIVANPERFRECTGIIGAYALLLKDRAQAVANELARRATPSAPPVEAQSEPQLSGSSRGEIILPPTIPFTSRFSCGDSLDFLQSQPAELYDHIICDPDFAVDVSRLSSNSANMAAGVAQASIDDSLDDLGRFIPLAYRAVRSSGFLAFFYDLDHHEKLQRLATSVGFNVQRWPVIWHKTDYRSNAAPQHNTCKNIEYVMVCRKPSATLAKVTMSSVISLPSGDTAKTFNHPFAKPPALWIELYRMFVLPGQTTFDPFLGAGSSACGAARFGAVPHGRELIPDHFANATLNIQREYKTLCGPSTIFI